MSQVPTMDHPRQKVPSKWIPYVRLAGISSLPLVWTNCLAGISMAGGQFDASQTWLLIAVSLIHVASMYLNHAFGQRSIYDVPRSQLLRRAYLILAAGALLIIIKTDYVGQPLAGAVMLSCAVIYYNRQHPTRHCAAFIGALCTILTYFVAASTVGTVIASETLIGATVLFAYAIGVGYVGEIDGLEARKLWPVPLLASPLIYLFREANLLAGLALVGWEIYSLSLLIDRDNQQPAVTINLITGIALVNATLVSAVPNHLDTAFLCFFSFLLSLGLRLVLHRGTEDRLL